MPEHTMKLPISPTNRFYLWLSLAGLVVALDLASKLWAESWFLLHQPQPLLPLLNLTLTYNTGAAFSFLSQAGGWQRWFFTGLSLTISLLLIGWLSRLERRETCTGLALALILAGAVGNLIDRAIYGHVIDFIDFFYPAQNSCLPLFGNWGDGTCHWPTFNVADSAISVGAVLLILSQFLDNKADETANKRQ
jgi:signal peptidase II